MTRRRRVLVVSYHFPPVGGAGVQRVAKFARYLPEFGWDVSVLQAANPSVPLRDESLLTELPADLVIERARTWEPSYAAKASGATPSRGGSSAVRRAARRVARLLLQPDAQILWYPAAVRHGLRLLRRLPHDAILATAPSYTNLLVGRRLALASGLPLLCDFRDEWDLSQEYWENAAHDRAARAVQRRMQRAVLRQAAAIVATTAASTSRLVARAAEAGAEPASLTIYNGWDAGDFAAATTDRAVPPRPGTFRLVYAGTLWNLTSIAPVADAIERLAASGTAPLARLELLALGRKTPEQQQQLERIGRAGCVLTDVPYSDHATAIATMRSADALLLLLSDLPGVERVVPAKLFEYFAAARPMLAVTPPGEAAALVDAVQPGAHHLPGDTAGIAAWLSQHLSQPGPGSSGVAPAAAIARYERRALAGQLAQLLDQVTARPR